MVANVANDQTTNSTSGNTTSITVPATAAAGQLAIITQANGGGSITSTITSGWSPVPNCSQSAASIGLEVWYKILNSADIGASVTITSNNTTLVKRDVFVDVYSGASLGNSNSKLETTAGTAHICPGVTANSSSAWAVNIVADRASPGSTSFVTPSNLTQREFVAQTGGAAVSAVFADDNNVGAGTVGANTITGTVSTANVAMATIIIEPATVSVPTVDAGADQTNIEPWATVLLSFASSWSNGSIDHYNCIQTAGTAVTLTNTAVGQRTYPAPGTLAGETETFSVTATGLVSQATETWTGTNGAAWPAGWSVSGVGTSSIQSNGGQLLSSSTGGAERAFYTGSGTFSDNEIAVTVLPTGTTKEWHAHIGLRTTNAPASGDNTSPNPTNGYVLHINAVNGTATTYQVVKYVNSVATAFATTNLATPLTNMKVRFSVEGGIINVKIWDFSAASEPTDWTGIFTDSSPYTTAGYPMLSVSTSSANPSQGVRFDDATFKKAYVSTAATTNVTVLACTERAVIGGVEVPMQVRWP